MATRNCATFFSPASNSLLECLVFGEAAAIPDYFYSAAAVIESDRYRWIMQDLDRVEMELKAKSLTFSRRLNLDFSQAITCIDSIRPMATRPARR